MQKRKTTKEEISGSETIFEKIKSKTPWIFGNSLRKPKIAYPQIKLPRMDMPLPGKSLVVIGIYVILFLLQMGIVYIIYREPVAIGADQQGNAVLLYPDLNDAFIIESIVASIFIFLCSIGFLFLYQASKYVYNKKTAIKILVIGMIFIITAFIALQAIITIKLGEKLFNV
ncbi:MAG: hypothetical protein ACFFBZ_08740 [Promethearchaeota archaeon]